MEIWQSVKQVRANIAPCQAWEQNQADYDAKRKELSKKDSFSPQKLEEAKKRGEIIINVTNKLNQYSDNKVQDVEAGIGYLGLLIKVPLALALGFGTYFYKHNYNSQKAFLAGLIGYSIPSIPLVLIGTSKQKEASRVARYQAREKILKNPRNFVIYTSAQLETAKKIAATMPDKPEKDIVEKFNKSIQSLLKDYKGYKVWKKESLERQAEREKLYNQAPLTSEQIKNAKNDQALIFRTVNKIDKKVKEYSFTTDMFSGLIFGSSILQAFLIEKPLENLIKRDWISKPIIPHVKMSTAIGGTIALAITLPLSLILKKDAAQVGRYKVKKELMSDPYNFVCYDQNEMNSKKNIKAPRLKTGFFNDLINDITFVPRAIKDSIEYSKYKKTKEPQDIKFKKALELVPISYNQLEDAKKMQSKLFRTFDKMDDESQRYSQDIEGASSLVKSLIEEMGLVIVASGLLLYRSLKKGNKELSFFKAITNNSSFSNFRKSFKKGRDYALKNSFGRLSPEQQKTFQRVLRKSKIPAIVLSTFSAFLCTYAGLTWLKKEAARVGIMKATQDLSDYRNFADYDDEKLNSSLYAELYSDFLKN